MNDSLALVRLSFPPPAGEIPPLNLLGFIYQLYEPSAVVPGQVLPLPTTLSPSEHRKIFKIIVA